MNTLGLLSSQSQMVLSPIEVHIHNSGTRLELGLTIGRNTGRAIRFTAKRTSQEAVVRNAGARQRSTHTAFAHFRDGIGNAV